MATFGSRGRVVTLAATVLLVACGAATDRDGAVDGEVIVSAAASLTTAMQTIETAYEATRPEVDVVLNLGGSSALREQVLAGAPVDVLATADIADARMLADAGRTDGPPVVIATNRMALVVPAANPGGVDGLADLADPDLLVGLCAPSVPCGAIARQMLADAGVTPSVDTNEPDVRALLAKVATGELDIGVVYVSDVVAAGGTVRDLGVPAGVNVEATYGIVVIDDAPHLDDARDFVAYVRSDAGQALLRDAGFGTP